MDQAGRGRRCLVADPSGVWCVQLQGGGGRQRGALATDDNAADVRTRPRDPGKIQTTPPKACREAPEGPRTKPCGGPFVCAARPATPSDPLAASVQLQDFCNKRPEGIRHVRLHAS
ncbi:hypothetical protein SLITK23_26530 [Streptomyces lividans]|nr:hypothetical protein SLITK23_26530 [Streptomyces lividans]